MRSSALVAIAAACTSAAGSEQPTLGDMISVRPGEYFRGWLMEGAGIGIGGQTYALFRRSNSLIIALTFPVSHSSRGGVEVAKITRVVSAKAFPGEEERDAAHCGWAALGRAGMPVLAFYDPQKAVARGYFAAKNRVFVARWQATPEDCPVGGE
jgi:hypothetical protein